MRGTTAVIFGAIAVAWLAYLVPWFIARKDSPDDDAEPTDRFSQSLTIIRRGTDPLADDPDPYLEVSTPLTRRAALREIKQTAKLAARRRRRVVLALVVVSVVVGGGLVAVPALPAWLICIPTGLLVAFLGVARFSVRTLNATLHGRAARLSQGWEDETISFEVPADLRTEPVDLSIELTAPMQTASLWDPIPVTAPTYVSRPLMPRSVRTIDLSPQDAVPMRHPVTADRAEPSERESPMAAADRVADAG